MPSEANFTPYQNGSTLPINNGTYIGSNGFNSFGMHSEIVLPPKSIIRIGDTVTTTEELELFVKVVRKLLKDSYPEELV